MQSKELAKQGFQSSLPAFDVFISYAHDDSLFAIALKDRLEAVGFEVWIDDKGIVPGDRLQPTIRAALLRSRQAVFLLSRRWLGSTWIQWELETFHGECEGRPKIAILLDPLSPGEIPHQFISTLRIEWPAGARNSDDHFRRLCDALSGRLSDRFSSTPAEEERRSSRSARWGKGRIVWGCDRTDQWMKVETHARKQEHEALFVLGPRGEAHDFFLDSVEECFPETPQRWIRKVFWTAGRLPQDKESFLRAVAESLPVRGGTASLKDSLRTCLRDRNLVLVHRPVMLARLDERLEEYYAHWLPDVLPEPGTTRGVLKAVQGLYWLRPVSSGSAQNVGVTQEVAQVLTALKKIRATAAGTGLSIVPLPELQPLTRAHLEDWIDSLPKEVVGDPEAFIRDALEGASHSADVLSQIVERLRAAEEPE